MSFQIPFITPLALISDNILLTRFRWLLPRGTR